MKKLLIYSTLFCAQFAATTVALGQKTYAIGLGGGAAIPVGKLSDIQKTGYNAMVTLAIGVSDLPIGVRFDGIYNNLSHPKATAGTSDLRVSGALANLVFAFPGPAPRRTCSPEAASITRSPTSPVRNRRTILA